VADERTYIRVHDGMPDHPKIDGLSDGAFRLLIEMWCLCSRHLTDGHVKAATWNKRATKKSRDELLTAGLVSATADGVVMHDYLEHQRSAAEVADLREKRRIAGAKGGKAKANGLASATANALAIPQQTRSKSLPESEVSTETDLPSVTLGGDLSKRSEPLPPPRCPEHLESPAQGACRACGDARKLRAEAEAKRAREASGQQSESARKRTEVLAMAIADCHMCDATGYVLTASGVGALCSHDPDQAERATAGAAAVRANIGRKGQA